MNDLPSETAGPALGRGRQAPREAFQQPEGIAAFPSALATEMSDAFVSLARQLGAQTGGLLRLDGVDGFGYVGGSIEGFVFGRTEIETLTRQEGREVTPLEMRRGGVLPCLLVPIPDARGDFRLALLGVTAPPEKENLEATVRMARLVTRLGRSTRGLLDERDSRAAVSEMLELILQPASPEEALRKLAEKVAAVARSPCVVIDSYARSGHRTTRSFYADDSWPNAAALSRRLGSLLSARARPPQETRVDLGRLRAWRRPLLLPDLLRDIPPALLAGVSEEELEFYRIAGVRTVVLDPLWVGDEFVGTLAIANPVLRQYSGTELEVVRRLGEVAAVATRAAQLLADLDESQAREREAYLESISRLAAAAEARDPYTSRHIGNVRSYTEAIAQALGLSDDFVQAVSLASQMHDVGKISLSDSILLKPGPLTAMEREIMQRHTVDGERLLHGNHLDVAREVARSHHERWDGKGYPDGLAGGDIPLCARVVSVADVYDALTSERPYKVAWDPEAAYAEILRCTGTQFDRRMVEVFAELWRSGVMTPGLQHAA